MEGEELQQNNNRNGKLVVGEDEVRRVLKGAWRGNYSEGSLLEELK